MLDLVGNPEDQFYDKDQVPFKFFVFFLIQFISYEIGQSLGEGKMGEPKKNHLAHPQAEFGQSYVWPMLGSNPHQTVVR